MINQNIKVRSGENINKYLVRYKSSGGGTLFSYRKLGKVFFFYDVIEKMMLYFSVLFDHYSTNIIIIKF
jgi:hypothetical protein